jgi:hypothetical protein
MLIFTFLTCIYQNCQYMYNLQTNTKLRIKPVKIMYISKTSNENSSLIWNGFGPFRLRRGVQVTAAAERQLMVFWRHPNPLINLFSWSWNTQINDNFTTKTKIQTYTYEADTIIFYSSRSIGIPLDVSRHVTILCMVEQINYIYIYIYMISHVMTDVEAPGGESGNV